jgi:protein-S-isoprenylcysteine O-methyltransferase Ste14
MNILIKLSLGWIIYFFIHSALASLYVKNLIIHKIHLQQHHYRKVYVTVAVLALIPIIKIIVNYHKQVIFIPYIVQVIGWLIIAVSFYLFPKAWRGYKLKPFLGLEPENNQQLVISGMHQCVRHPLYSVSILFLVGILLIFPANTIILSCILILMYFYIGTVLEENKLRIQFGDEYEQYKKQVPMFFPKLKKCLKKIK